MVSVNLMLGKAVFFTPSLASAMEKYPCTVKLIHNGSDYNVKSVLGLAAAGRGEGRYQLVCDGEEELCALREAEKLICGSGSLCV
ncbi:MAG: HPr family phosphocarrier protein [Ruminococcus sp.]|nr:HPr family phosphocarrier protein [Ruminococcus sp.]